MPDDYIFGLRAVIEAVNAGKKIDKVLMQNGLHSDLAKELLQLLTVKQIPFQYVPQEKLNKISRKNHQGAIAYVAPIDYTDIEVLVPMLFEQGKMPLILVLDRITDVRNFGAIARSAECAGAHAIVIPEKGGARVTSDSIKTSAGALHSLPVCQSRSMMQTIEYLQQSGLKVVAATEKADTTIYNAKLNEPIALIMGSEETGISKELLKIADEKVSIPLQGTIASLNVSAAASVIMFEALRQRIAK